MSVESQERFNAYADLGGQPHDLTTKQEDALYDQGLLSDKHRAKIEARRAKQADGDTSPTALEGQSEEHTDPELAAKIDAAGGGLAYALAMLHESNGGVAPAAPIKLDRSGTPLASRDSAAYDTRFKRPRI